MTHRLPTTEPSCSTRRGAGVIADFGLAGNEGVAAKSKIGGGVGNLQQFFLLNGMGAKSVFARNLSKARKTKAGL